MKILQKPSSVLFTKCITRWDLVVVELKSIRELATVHEDELVNYLKETGIEVGLLVNFGPEEAEVKRKIKDLPDKTSEDQQDTV